MEIFTQLVYLKLAQSGIRTRKYLILNLRYSIQSTRSFFTIIQHFQCFNRYLRIFPIFQRQDKIQVRLVIHLSGVGQALFKDPVDKGGGESARAVTKKFFFAQHSVMVLVEVQVLTLRNNLNSSSSYERFTLDSEKLDISSNLISDKIDFITIHSKSRRRREPVCFLGIFGKILITEFQKVVEKAASKNIKNPDLSGVKRIEKEEKFPYGRANIEGVKGFVQSVKLR